MAIVHVLLNIFSVQFFMLLQDFEIFWTKIDAMTCNWSMEPSSHCAVILMKLLLSLWIL